MTAPAPFLVLPAAWLGAWGVVWWKDGRRGLMCRACGSETPIPAWVPMPPGPGPDDLGELRHAAGCPVPELRVDAVDGTAETERIVASIREAVRLRTGPVAGGVH